MTRELSAREAESLEPGADHYRAYVGPPGRFGLLTQLQLGILNATGLEETDSVLDFGCGSLRLGRSLIPFLDSGNYYGIDPNGWLIEDGFKRETGESLRMVKEPVFSTSDQFDCTVFGVDFDFIMAQSVITHSGAQHTEALIKSAAKALKEDGIILLSYIRGEPGCPLPEQDWTYPHNVPYPPEWLENVASASGLIWRDLEWFHPGAQWAALAKHEARFPDNSTLGLHGRPADRWRATG